MLTTTYHERALFGVTGKVPVGKTPVCHQREGWVRIQGAAVPPTQPQPSLMLFSLEELSLLLQPLLAS